MLSQILSRPRLQVLTQTQQWIAWGVAGLVAAWIGLRTPRSRALKAGLGMIFAAVVISFLAFQASLIWCPPTMPAALIAVGMIIARVLGKRALSAPEISPEASPPASS
jgi:CHASE2 domain-containing sensor protein